MSLASIYNRLRPVEEVTAELKANSGVLQELAQILVQNDLHESYDIRLIHSHFNISGDERVVTFDANNSKVSLPYTHEIVSAKVAEEFGITATPSDGQVSASDYMVTESGLVPYEFSYGSNPSTNVAVTKNVLHAWSGILRARGMDDILGLAVRDGVDVGGFEESDPDARWSRVSYEEDAPGDGKPGFLTTSWRIENPELGLIELKQCSFCTSLKRHGKTSSCTN